jgi:zinc/manganese transport system substrate-binding protein
MRSLPRLVALTAAATLALAACSTAATDDTARPTGSADQRLAVVASTNVYGDIAQQVGGDLVDVTSIIEDPSADPHSYEASTQTQLALSRADLVIENGGGYDDFVDTMLGSLDDQPVLVNVVDLSGRTATDGGELNEHVWYDFPTVSALAEKIAAELGALDTAHAAQFETNAAAFTAEVTGLQNEVADLATTVTGEGVAITEPVPGYLLDAAGLVDKTPVGFSKAVEEGTDVPPADLRATLDLFSTHAVSVLVYNEQTTGAETERVLQAAKDAGVPVVPVTETLPAGQDYVSWMTANVDALRAALAS